MESLRSRSITFSRFRKDICEVNEDRRKTAYLCLLTKPTVLQKDEEFYEATK